MRTIDRFALALSPLLIRLVLAATFLWFGLPKLHTTIFTGHDANTLIAMGLTATPSSTSVPQDPDLLPETTPEEVINSAAPEGDTPKDAETPDTPGEIEEVVEDVAEAGEDAADDVETVVFDPNAQVEARKLYGIALMLHNAGHPRPVLFAWLATVTEVVGGALLLVGFMSRFWATGLAIAMVYAFILTSWASLTGLVDPPVAGFPGIWAAVRNFGGLDFHQQISAFHQISSFALAFTVMLCGAGMLSLDRIIFGSRHKKDTSNTANDID